MVVVLYLGANDEYLGYRPFKFKFQAELFVDKLAPLMLANIEKTMSLKERLQLAPEYFPFAGRLQDIDLIELTTDQGEKSE